MQFQAGSKTESQVKQFTAQRGYSISKNQGLQESERKHAETPWFNQSHVGRRVHVRLPMFLSSMLSPIKVSFSHAKASENKQDQFWGIRESLRNRGGKESKPWGQD